MVSVGITFGFKAADWLALGFEGWKVNAEDDWLVRLSHGTCWVRVRVRLGLSPGLEGEGRRHARDWWVGFRVRQTYGQTGLGAYRLRDTQA